MRMLIAAVVLAVTAVTLAEENTDSLGDARTDQPQAKAPATRPSADEFPSPAELVKRMKQAEQKKSSLTKVAYFNLTRPIEEKPADFSLFGDDGSLTLRSLLDRLHMAQQDADIKAVLITLGADSGISFSQAQEVRNVLAGIVKSGKPCFVYADSYDTPSYTLATGANHVCMLEGGEIMVPGVGIEVMFLKGLLDKVGIKADYEQIGEYKGADEEYTRAEASEELKGELNKLTDALYNQIVDGISGHRNLTKDEVRGLIDRTIVTGQAAREQGFVDHLLDQDGLRPLLLNGIALGMATSLKYNGALVFAGIAAAQTLRGRAEGVRWQRLLARLTVTGVVGLVTLALTSPFLVLDPGMTQHGLGYIFAHLGRATAPAIGWVQLSRALWYGIDPVLVLLAIVGVGYAAWRRQPADLIVLTFLIVYFLLIGAGGSVFLRYADPMIPLLLLLGGRALAALVALTSRGRPRQLALGVALVLIMVAPLIHDLRYDLLIQQTDTRTLAFDWLAAHLPPGSRAAVPYMAGPSHDQAMIDSGKHSHGATDLYVASFLDSRLESQYTIRELTHDDLQLTALDSFRREGITYVVVGYETPGTGCGTLSPLEQALRAEGAPLATFSPTNGCPDSVFDPIDTYYVPLAGYGGWVRPGPQIRIYRLSG